MGLLLLLALVVLIYWFTRDKKSAGTDTSSSYAQMEQQNASWVSFIAGYRDVVRTKAEKKLVDRMLDDLSAQGFAAAAELRAQELGAVAPGQMAAATTPWTETTATLEMPQAQSGPQSRAVQLDNTTILLYFGAFLFVASIGLFVAFSGFSGTVRTFAVALVALVMYDGGTWLFRNRPKLQQAGLAFAGIGLATAPFVGLAAYNFILNRSSGAAVWFLTSLACLGMYVHALLTLKKPLLNYILIFTFLSLIESAVAVINAPIYYFGWGFAAVGIGLSILGRTRGFDRALQDASASSAKVLVPLASGASLIVVGTQGVGQLGVSLLLAAAYYATEFRYGKATARAEHASASQVAALMGVTALAYALHTDLWVAAAALVACNLLQTAILYAYSRQHELWTNFASIVLLGGVVAVFVSVASPGMLLTSLTALAVTGVVLWCKQSRVEAYGVAVVAWMVLPLVFGQFYLQPHLESAQQVMLSFAALLLQWTLVTAVEPRDGDRAWRPTAKVLYMLSVASVLLTGCAASPLVFLLLAVAVAGSIALLAEYQRDASWTTIAGIVIALPVLRNADEYGWLALSIVLALAANIAIALRYRQEVTRWLGSGLWLLLPVSLGNGVLGHWTPVEFGWAYMVIFAGFVVARAIARGVLFVSGKVPMSSYEKTASVSYVFGYCLAGFIAIFATGFSMHSQLHTSLVLTLLGAAVWLLAVVIERQPEACALLPFVAQALLLSALRPKLHGQTFDAFLFVSSLLSVIGYMVLTDIKHPGKLQTSIWTAVRQASLITAAIPPVTFLFVGETRVMMPIGLLIFTAMLYHKMRSVSQRGREWIGGLGLVGLWWLMYFAGVRNLQAYTHTLVALFGVYAYWRHVRKEENVSEAYLVAMLATATVPLALQALTGVAGGLYGWWLLLEQVFFMLLGMMIRKPLVTRWGLYVAVGAVIYQLRSLGWAALSVLAIFLIGLAIYRLQRSDKTK